MDASGNFYVNIHLRMLEDGANLTMAANAGTKLGSAFMDGNGKSTGFGTLMRNRLERAMIADWGRLFESGLENLTKLASQGTAITDYKNLLRGVAGITKEQIGVIDKTATELLAKLGIKADQTYQWAYELRTGITQMSFAGVNALTMQAGALAKSINAPVDQMKQSLVGMWEVFGQPYMQKHGLMGEKGEILAIKAMGDSIKTLADTTNIYGPDIAGIIKNLLGTIGTLSNSDFESQMALAGTLRATMTPEMIGTSMRTLYSQLTNATKRKKLEGVLGTKLTDSSGKLIAVDEMVSLISNFYKKNEKNPAGMKQIFDALDVLGVRSNRVFVELFTKGRSDTYLQTVKALRESSKKNLGEGFNTSNENWQSAIENNVGTNSLDAAMKRAENFTTQMERITGMWDQIGAELNQALAPAMKAAGDAFAPFVNMFRSMAGTPEGKSLIGDLTVFFAGVSGLGQAATAIWNLKLMFEAMRYFNPETIKQWTGWLQGLGLGKQTFSPLLDKDGKPVLGQDGKPQGSYGFSLGWGPTAMLTIGTLMVTDLIINGMSGWVGRTSNWAADQVLNVLELITGQKFSRPWQTNEGTPSKYDKNYIQHYKVTGTYADRKTQYTELQSDTEKRGKDQGAQALYLLRGAEIDISEGRGSSDYAFEEMAKIFNVRPAELPMRIQWARRLIANKEDPIRAFWDGLQNFFITSKNKPEDIIKYARLVTDPDMAYAIEAAYQAYAWGNPAVLGAIIAMKKRIASSGSAETSPKPDKKPSQRSVEEYLGSIPPAEGSKKVENGIVYYYVQGKWRQVGKEVDAHGRVLPGVKLQSNTLIWPESPSVDAKSAMGVYIKIMPGSGAEAFGDKIVATIIERTEDIKELMDGAHLVQLNGAYNG